MPSGNDNNLNRTCHYNHSSIINNSRRSNTRYGDEKIQCIGAISVDNVRMYPIGGTVSVPHQCM